MFYKNHGNDFSLKYIPLSLRSKDQALHLITLRFKTNFLKLSASNLTFIVEKSKTLTMYVQYFNNVCTAL